MDAKMAHLGDIARLQAGVGFPLDLQGRRTGAYPLAKVGDISRGGRSGELFLNSADHYVDDEDLPRLGMRPVPTGSVLFAKIGEAIRQNHRVIAGRPMLIDNNAMAAVPGPRVDGKYLFHFLRSVDFYRLTSATTVPALRKSELETILVRLPPVEEQQRIADVLDRANDLRIQRRRVQDHLELLAQSVFVDTFGNPATNPLGFKIQLFGDIGDTRLGKMLDAKQQTGLDKRSYLRNANVQWFRFALDDVFEMDFDEKSRKVLRLEPGDLLICEGGEPGRAAVWQGEIDECYFQKALHRTRADPAKADPTYLAWFLWFGLKRGALKDYITSATIAHLTGEKLKTLPVVLPPIALQHDFVSKLKRLDKIKLSAGLSSKKLDELFMSLQYRAFSGDLRVMDHA